MEIKYEPVPHILMETKHNIRGWYSNLGDEKPRTCTTEHFLINPYMGYCHMGCKYCYINVLPNIEPPIRAKMDEEGKKHRYTIVDLTYPERVGKILDNLKIGFCAYIQPFNECFNPLEDIYHITQATAYEFVKRGLPISFTTKRVVPDWVEDYLKYNPHSYIHYSINTSDEDDYKAMSPGASSISELLEDIKKLSSIGIHTTVRLDPLIPGISFSPSWDMSSLMKLIDQSIDVGARHFVLSIVEIKGALMAPFIKFIAGYKGLETANFFEGCLNQFSKSSYRCSDDIKMYVFDQLSHYIGNKASLSLCTEHIKYDDIDGSEFVDLNDNYMKGTKSCHGMEVPIYYKGNGGRFYPLAGCSGSCLKCVSSVCGIDRLKYGMANKLSHYKKMEVSK